MGLLTSVVGIVSGWLAVGRGYKQGKIDVKLVIGIVDKRRERVIVYVGENILDGSGCRADIADRDSDFPLVAVE